MNIHIGAAIKRIRLLKNIDRGDLARRTKIPESDLETIEEQSIEPAISDLLRIASALGTDIATLLSGPNVTENRIAVTRKDARTNVERRGAYGYESLASSFHARHIEPFVVELFGQSEDSLDFSRHSGEEFHYVIEGTVRVVIDNEERTLSPGDSIYFDSSLLHALAGVGGPAKIVSALYNSESLLHVTRSKYMRDLIAAAKHLGGRAIAVVCPGKSELEAVNMGIREGVIETAYMIGDEDTLPPESLDHRQHYRFIPVAGSGNDSFHEAAEKGTALVSSGECQMLMKGHINTAIFIKAVLHEKNALSTDRRLSLTSIFELPDIDRLIFLTDPGINPALFAGKDLKASMDIINNAIDAAHALGVARPKVALLEANELPSETIPATLFEQELTAMSWTDADVFGPLSYDLALYKEAAEEKGITNNPVAGKADILVVPYISSGNILYKAWAMTMNAEAANVVLGARVPLIMSSRSDTKASKFLTICVSAVYSEYLRSRIKR